MITQDKIGEVALGVLSDYETRFPGFYTNEAHIGIVTESMTLSKELMTGGDVYDLLDELGELVKRNGHPNDAVGIALDTCGWAAPISDDDDGSVSPSQNKLRRRVRLVTLMFTNGKQASVLKFEDTNEEVLDFGDASGPLADAIRDAFAV